MPNHRSKRLNNPKITILANLLPGFGAGGIVSALGGLVQALGKLDGDEQYVLFKGDSWLKDYMGPNEILYSPEEEYVGWQERAKQVLGPLRVPVGNMYRTFKKQSKESNKQGFSLATSNGSYERTGGSVIHFPYQYFVKTKLPSVFSPWDLQYIHLPELFTPEQLQRNEVIYREGIHQASFVIVGSQWTKQDVIDHFDIPASKIIVSPWASPTESHHISLPTSLKAVARKYELERDFCLYPAALWPHKNHIRLLEALALLRDRDGLRIMCICTGFKHLYWHKIEQAVQRLQLHDQVRFPGEVEFEDLLALYQLSKIIVFPSLFEGVGLPVFEAWHANKPLLCSNMTSLPEIVGNAGMLFNPLEPSSIAKAIKMVWEFQRLSDELVKNGKKRLAEFSWDLTAKTHRAVYRKAAGKNLTDEDEWLLKGEWISSGTSSIQIA
jgi:glycosyltransferase involved in cell wall biosynthesis